MTPIQSNPLNSQENRSAGGPLALTRGWILQSGQWLGPLAIILTFILFAKMTWMHWGNLRVDCGREMYVPQQLARGRMLYRDLWYPYGPVAPYWNALLFKLFGDSLTVLYFSGLSITLTFAFALWAVARRFLPPFGSFIAVLFFLLQAFQTDLFNYILPYSYSGTLGSLLALIFLYFLIRHVRREPWTNLMAAGVVAGLALATKTEYGEACYLTLGLYLLFQFCLRRSFRTLQKELVPTLFGLLIPIAIYGWFVARLSISFFIKDSWTRQWYAQWLSYSGFRFHGQEILRLGLIGLMSVILWFVLAWLIKYVVAEGRGPLIRRALLLAGLVVALYVRWAAFFPLGLHYALQYLFFPQGVFWLVCAFALWITFRWKQNTYGREWLSPVVLCCFAVALSLRVMCEMRPIRFFSMFYDAELFIVFLMIILTVGRYAASKLSLQKQSLVLIILMTLEGAGLLAAMYPWRTLPSIPLQTERGRIYAPESEVNAFSSLIQFMRKETDDGKSVLVLPEETALYFFAGVEAPSRWYMLHPGVLEPEEKERRYIAQLEAHHVEFIVLFNHDARVYDAPFVGGNPNPLVNRWIRENFSVVKQMGQFDREKPWQLGVLIYQRLARSATIISGSAH